MANPDHVKKLIQMSVDEWSNWRRFQKIDLIGADLSQGDFSGKDLSGADMLQCNLTRAVLAGCKLQGTILRYATLNMTDIEGASIWESCLFNEWTSQVETDLPMGGQTTIRSVQDLLDKVESLTTSSGDQIPIRKMRLYFRGVSDESFDLIPSVMRDSKLKSDEDRLLTQLTTRRPIDFGESLLHFQRLVVAQHFRLPTRLLDLTSNPLVGMHYASEENPKKPPSNGVLHCFIVPVEMIYPYDSDTVSLVSNFSRLEPSEKDTLLSYHVDHSLKARSSRSIEYSADHSFPVALLRLNHFVAQEKPYWKERVNIRDLFRVLIVEPQRQFDRLRAHSGAFMLSAFHDRFERCEVDRWFKGAAPYHHLRFVMPDDAKKDIRRQLAMLNITEETLMADLQSSATAVKDEVEGR